MNNNLGSCYLALKQISKAQEAFEKAVKINPENATGYYNLGTALQLQQKHEEAYICLKQAYELDSSEFYLSSAAVAAINAEKWEDAIKYYQKLTSLHPEKQNFQYNLACAYQALENYDKAISLLSQLAMLNPKSIAMGQRLADCYEKTGQYAQAQNAYENLIRLGKIPPSVYYKYALLCVRTDNKDKAETIFKKVIQLEPTNAYAHKDLGVVYLSQRLFDYAKDEFLQAQKLAPNDALINFELANFYYATSDFITASTFYEKAYGIEPTNIDINTFRGLNCIALNNLDKALEIFLKIRKNAPANHIALFNIGLIYFKQANFDAAKEFLSDAYSLYQNAETINALALCFYELGEYENARNLAIKLKEKYPDNINVLLLLAKSYIELGDVQNSVETLEQIMQIFPDQPEAKELYARVNPNFAKGEK